MSLWDVSRARRNVFTARRPALDMSPEQIAQAINADRDPSAEAAETYKIALLFQLPLCQLMLAARFGTMLAPLRSERDRRRWEIYPYHGFFRRRPKGDFSQNQRCNPLA